MSFTRSQGYDLSIIAATGVALFAYASLGGLLALGSSCLPLAFGLHRYVPEEKHVFEGLVGLLEVVLGGMAPPSMLFGTPFGYWLVDDNPLPLALGIAILVVLFALALRRVLSPFFEPPNAGDPSGQ